MRLCDVQNGVTPIFQAMKHAARMTALPRAATLGFWRVWQEPVRALLAQDGGPDELRTVLWYILQVNAEIDQEQLGDVMLKHFGPEAEEVAVTAGQRLIQQGRQEGRQEARVRLLLRQLTLRFGELSPETTARVQAADEQALERLSERVITATTLSGVFDDS